MIYPVLRLRFEIDVQPVPAWITKIIQVYHCMVARHGNMIVGKTGSGKSEAWKMLKSAMGNLKKNGVVAENGEFEKVSFYLPPLPLGSDGDYR